MEKQFKNNFTFFDLNIGEQEENELPFATLYYYVKGQSKSRYLRNRAAVEFLKGHEISEEDKKLIDSYFDGSVKENNKRKYEHCKICTDQFERNVLQRYSRKYKYWEVCFPTHPYTPGSLMIYLNDRVKSHIEDIGQLSSEAFQELIEIVKDLYDKLKECWERRIVGINVLFNQISKTQLCIHGHIEPMIKEIQKLNLGAELKTEEPYDPMATFLNDRIPEENGIYKVKQGLRIDLNVISNQRAMEITEEYKSNIGKLVEYAKENRKKQQVGEKVSSIDEYLVRNISPAPVEYIYITYYRNRLFLSIVPELTLKQAKIDKIEDTEKELYGLRISNHGATLEEKIRIQKPPLIRPCLKVSTNDEIEGNIEEVKKNILSEIEK